MNQAQDNPFLRQIRHLIGEVPGARLTDGQLLERFLTQRDETAVEVLVRRYGPLVFGVCRRVLRNAHAAEDAFQATFLVLVRKAPSLDRAKPLGSWLYTVAYRLALRARANESRRQACEMQAAQGRAEMDVHNRTSELAAALEEELQRLPERHRVPLVLCYLEGKTNEQAAQALGCPRGSMSWRLTQARDVLRERLSRRGLVCPAAGLAAVFAAEAAPAAVPLPLLHNTARAAVWFSAGQETTAGAVSTQAVTLAKGALKAMFMNKLKIAAGLLLAVSLLGAGTTMLVKAAAHTDPPVTEARDEGTPPPKVKADQAGDARLPGGAVARLGTTQLRHGDGIFFAAYMPDGKALLTAGKERTIRLWDLATRRELRRFDRGAVPEDEDAEPPPEDGGGTVDKKMDRRMLATLGMDFQVTLSRDGKIVAANRAGTVLLWDTATGQKLREIKTGKRTVYQLVFSADAKSLLTLDRDQSVSIWDVATGRHIKTVARKTPSDRDAGQMAAVSPGFKYLAWQHAELATQSVFIKLMDLTTGEELPTIKAPLGGAFGMVFSADDKLLAWSGFLGGLVLWDVAAGKELRNFGGGFYDPATSLAFSPDGKLLAASRANATVELWDIQSGKQVRRIGQAPSEKGAAGMIVLLAGMGAMARSALAFSPDGTRLAVSLGGPMIRQFQVATGEELAPQAGGHQAPVAHMALSDDGKSLRSYGHGDAMRSWDLASGAETRRLELPPGTTGIAFGTNGRFISTAGKTVFLRDAEGKELRKIEAGTLAVAAVAVSPDGATLATRDVLNPEVRLWDSATGKARATLGRGGDSPKATGLAVSETVGVVPPDLVFSPDGRFLAGAGAKRQLCLWDVAAAAPVWEVAPATGQAILRFVFSANGRNLAALNGDGTITLYETATGEPRARLGQPDKKTSMAGFTVSVAGMSLALADRRDAPVALAFSPDGRLLATAKDTPEIHLWDLMAGQEVGRLTGHQGGIASLLFTRDGQRLVSGSTDTTTLTWDVSRYLHSATRPTALDSSEPGALWTDLAGTDATKAFEAIRRLSATPDRAAALVRERVRPVSPPDPERLARWVADLESDRFSVRRQAESELEQLGEQAAPTLRKALEGEPSLDLRQRITRLLRKTSGSTSARGLVRDLRAVELLELAGGRPSRQVLETLAGGSPDAALTREAKAAATRLAKQQSDK
jgi:RNA polymerase sigma factor (sigma-70 family)